MKKIIASLLVASFAFTPFTYSKDIFDEFDSEMNEFESPDQDKIVQEYLEFIGGYLAEYDQWRKEYLNEFDKQQAKIINKWGGTTAEDINTTTYSTDLNTRESVDYENNKSVIEILVPADTNSNEAQNILLDYIENESTTNLAKSIIDENIQLSEITLTDDQQQNAIQVIKKQTIAYKKEADIKADKFESDQEDEANAILEQSLALQKAKLEQEEKARIAAVKSQYQQLKKSKINPTVKMKVLKYTADLPKNTLSQRAKKYKPMVEKQSQRFDIPAALVMAIMHSESAFQPDAKSAVPAYGLMQIVPRTAGHDVNKAIRKIDKPMLVKDLYQPNINIETGSAYLDILDKRYLKSITNPQSRLYCTIAAYNTGAGNVAKAFNTSGNRRNINKAAKEINQLTPSQVYDVLMNKLPYDETKHYLKKVSQRIALYQAKADI